MNVNKIMLLSVLTLSIAACNGSSNKTNTTATTGSGSTSGSTSTGSTTTNSVASKTFDEFWNLFDRYYPLMYRKDINWQTIYEQNHTKITNATTNQELSKIIGDIVNNVLKDGHTNAQYKQEEFGYQPELTAQQTQIANMLQNTDALIDYEATSTNNPYISYGRLKSDNNIGYIKSKVFEPAQQEETEFTKFKQIVDKALTDLQNTQGIIVDVRTNGGGSGGFAYYLAGRFATDAPKDVVRMRYKTTTGSTEASLSDWVTSEFQGYADKRAEGGYMAPTGTDLNQFNASGDFQYANKVALLTGQESASAAEFFTVVMKSQSQVRSIGDRTFGIFSGSEMVTLDSDKDWKVRISVHDVEVNYNGTFQSFEGIGIPADQMLYPTAEQVSAGKDIHIEAAVNYINNTTSSVSTSSCDFESTPVETITYNFDGNFEQTFIDSPKWESHSATLQQASNSAVLTANSDDTSTALEAWKLYNRAMPYNQSWQLSVTTKVPLYWNTNGGNEAQVGAGVFVGKPVPSGQSSKVYETNMAAINGGGRFAQAQLVANRLGEDPIDVQHVELDNSKEQAQTTIRFCSADKTLSYFVDGQQVGKSQAIDSTGLDNWGLTDGDVMDIGIMGFAENTTIQANSPSLQNFTVRLY